MATPDHIVADGPRPARWRSYYELTKPRVVMLIVFTSIVGTLLAVPGMPPLDALILPEDLQPGVRALRASVEAQQSAWTAFLSRLEQTEGGFDLEGASDELNAIARGWYEYKVAHNDVNDVLRSHIAD